ncbi:MAG: leucine-rich repeat domain-containing protein [Clostridia bacterium]|nr:leucine-rich repeat domain-containing protein [Clostridia bacterium]
MKKLLLIATLSALLVFLFIFSASAVDGSTSDEFGEVTEVSGMTSEMLDRDAKVVLKNANGTFSTYYTYYIYPKKAWNNAMKTPDFNQLNNATGENYTASSMIRVELLSDITAFELPSDAAQESLKEIVFPDDLAMTTLPRLNSSIFLALEKVYIGSGFTQIDGNAFRDLPKLKYVIFSKNFSLTTLSNGMFINCDSLEEIEIPNSVTKINGSLLADCSSLKSVRLSASATSLEGAIFIENGVIMPSLKMIYMPSGITSLNRANFTYGNEPTSAITIFFVGTLEQMQAIISSTNITSLKNATLDEWDETKDDSYYIPPTDTTNWRIVYNYNKCNAFYGGVHTPDPEKTSACADTCKICELTTIKENPAHTLSTIYDFESYVLAGKKTVSCANEGCPLHQNPEISDMDPIFTLLGFSFNSTKTKIVVGYRINEISYKSYGKDLTYGVLAYIPNGASADPLTINDGKAVAKDPQYTIFADITETSYFFDFIISGLPQTSISLIMCAYVCDGNSITYLCYDGSDLAQDSVAYAYNIENGTVSI